MFKRLFVLVFLTAALLFVSSPAHAALLPVSSSAPAASGPTTARSCAQADIGHIHLYGVDAPMLIEHYYYSDATYTVQVGYRYNNQCTGQSYMIGTQTSYFIREGSYCSCSLC